MLSFPVEPAAWSLRGKPPAELPHGLLAPPEFVRELIAEEKAKFRPGIYTTETEERQLSEYTLQWFFDQLGHEVLYRQTPHGPEVLAVGYDEIFALTDFNKSEKMKGIQTWMPWPTEYTSYPTSHGGNRMSPPFKALGFDQFTVEQRIALVQEIWDSIAADAHQPLLTEAQRQELERRVAQDDASPDDVIPWEQVQAEALARLQK